MRISINNNITFDEFKLLIRPQSKENTLNSLSSEMKKLEYKYNMKSSEFYSKYISDNFEFDDDDGDDDFEFWYSRIVMYAKYSNLNPQKIEI